MSTNLELADTLPPPGDEQDSLADKVMAECRGCGERHLLDDGVEEPTLVVADQVL